MQKKLVTLFLSGCVFLTGCASTPSKPSAETATLLQLGEMSAQSGDYEHAESLYQEAYQRDPHNPAALLKIADIEGVRDQHQKAISIYKQVLTMDAKNRDAQHGLARSYISLGQNDLALVEYQKLVQADPSDVRVFSGLGVILDGIGEYRTAAVCYLHGRALKPQDPNILNNYALSVALSGNLFDGINLLEEANRLEPSERFTNNIALLKREQADLVSKKKHFVDIRKILSKDFFPAAKNVDPAANSMITQSAQTICSTAIPT